MRPEQEHFSVAEPGVGFLELNASLPNRLHFRAGQRDPGLEPLEQVVPVGRGPVGREVTLLARRLCQPVFPEPDRERASIARPGAADSRRLAVHFDACDRVGNDAA